MKYSSLHNTTILPVAAAIAAAGMLAGCGGANTAPTLPQSNPPARAAAGLGPQNLLYVSNSNGLVNVYRYWQKNLVAVLPNFSKPMGMCVDNDRNVYITDYGAETIVEYPHGGSTPIQTFDDSPYAPYACSVDPTTGNLAVANWGPGGERSSEKAYGNVAIYKRGKQTPKLYAEDSHFNALSYDGQGDLLAASFYRQSIFSETYFYYLPKHGADLLPMDLPNAQLEDGWPTVQSINYDGTYWVATADNIMFRYTIGVKAVEVDYMKLTGVTSYVGELWLYRKTRKAQATQVVAGDGAYNSTNTVDYWKYPVAADPIASISGNLDKPFGVTISLRTSK